MKTKRIVALALTAAMAVSMASTTAFAAETKHWSDYILGNKTAENVAQLTNDPAPTRNVVGVKTGDTEWTEGFFVNYEVYKTDADAANDARTYLYRGGSSIKSDTVTQADGSTKTYTQKVINDQDTTQTGNEVAGVLWKNFKGVAKDLGEPSLELEHNVVFLGWSLDSTKKGYVKGYSDNFDDVGALPSDTKASDVCLQDMDDIIEKAQDIQTKDGTDGKTITFYPVFRKKTAAEKLASQVEIAKRAKVAKPVGEKEWVYTQKDLDRSTAYVSAPLAEAVSGDALKKCNAEMKHSRVYEVKPQVTDPSTRKPVLVDLKKGATENVKLRVTTIYDATGATVLGKISNEDDLKKLIKNGKLKVFHIGSDGKSRQVTNLGTTTVNNEPYITFKSGFYSEFVVTKDPNARAQAGEEDGASGGNPATGEASTLPVAMLALAALSATGVVAYKKRKAE